ncbi:helicase [Chlorogloea sp. CCALA 695]|nr:helicase [Chlorogloea sp. CCALA 695]
MIIAENRTVELGSAGTIQVKSGSLPKSLYQHQNTAIQKLNIINRSPFKGLLVLPTGGGKTLTAVHWLLQNFINKHKKVLWIAHRHELLNQAFNTIVDSSYSELLSDRTNFRYRIISGSNEHDIPVNIQATDDIIIASKDSLNSGMDYLLNKWANNLDEVLLVVDEAHHATAKTYRKVIHALEESKPRTFKMLGLTATPFRTAIDEGGLLKQIFPDDIIFKEDLRSLITIGILADPIFEELPTKLEIYNDLLPKHIKAIQAFDNIPEDIAIRIATSCERNNQIVDQYFNNIEKYKQLIVFAINKVHASALNGLFNEKGEARGINFKSQLVLADITDAATGVKISGKTNALAIQEFRNGQTNVLVNVNILTEGVDLPNLQTVFLTRPTTSTIFMTQMIGRALRGEKAGGTKEAFIVSFIDDWKNKINWVNPEKLIESEGTFSETTKERDTSIVRLISIEEMEKFAVMMDTTIDTFALEKLDFLKRMPLGIYKFSILEHLELQEDLGNKNYEVLLYDDTEQAYEDFINDLSSLFESLTIGDREELNSQELEALFTKVKIEYFANFHSLTGYRDEDIKNILRYYAQNEKKPDFLAFKNRKDCDLAKVASHIYDKGLGGVARTEYVNSLWENRQNFWQVLFGYEKRYFKQQLDIEIYKIEEPEKYEQTHIKASVEHDRVDIHSLPLSEIKERDFDYYRKLKDSIYAKHTDTNGDITCAISGVKSKRRLDFQIDHIKPMAKGGLSTIDNLQVLSRKAHTEKTRQQNLARNSVA